MIRNNPETMVEFLNSLLEFDNAALCELIEVRVTCNQKMCDHPSVQVQNVENGAPYATVGLLGILNGFFGTYDESPCKGYGPIAVSMSDNMVIEHFGLTRDIFPDDTP